MKFLLMLTDIEGAWDRLSAAEQGAVMKQHGEVERELRAAKKYHGCARLGPIGEAKTVRLGPGGKRVVTSGPNLMTDGPHAETKEVMGGYYIIESDSVEEAVEWGKKIPMAYCSMEVRQIIED